MVLYKNNYAGGFAYGNDQCAKPFLSTNHWVLSQRNTFVFVSVDLLTSNMLVDIFWLTWKWQNIIPKICYLKQTKTQTTVKVLDKHKNNPLYSKNTTLVGGFNPFQKYDRQIGSSPQVGVKNIKNIWNHQGRIIPGRIWTNKSALFPHWPPISNWFRYLETTKTARWIARSVPQGRQWGRKVCITKRNSWLQIK